MTEKYLFQMLINLTMVGQLIVAGIIFFHPLPKKRHYFLRFSVALLINLIIFLFAVGLRLHFNHLSTRFVMRLLQLSMPLIIVLMAYEGGLHTKLKLWCTGIAAMQIGVALYAFFQAMWGQDGRFTISFFDRNRTTPIDWIIFCGFRILLYLLLSHFWGEKHAEELNRSSHHVTIALSLCSVLFLTIPDCLSNEFRETSYTLYLVNKSYLLALAAFILAQCSSIDFRNRYHTDMAIMEQVLSEERKQYQKMKENMDIINMRCHDLRHLLDDYSGKLTEEEVSALQEAMNIYDSNIKTGSDVLDVILHLNQLSCQNDGIEVTCLADGRALHFMSTRHLYFLFNNALGNAVEAVKKVPLAEKRIISITVANVENTVSIDIVNYFSGARAAPYQTTKKDTKRHGFGLMSMRYIAEGYGGTLSVRTEGDIYTLHITLPIPCETP